MRMIFMMVNTWIMRLGLSFVVCFTAFSPTLSQTCCSGGVPISTNLGLPPSFKGTWQFALTYDLNSLTTLKEGTDVIEDQSRERRTHSFILSSGYAFSNRFSMEILLPYVRQQREINQNNGFGSFELTEGLGDLLILFKYRLTPVSNTNHILSLGAGPKFGTGSSEEVNDMGLPLNLDLQPGSGANDLIFWGNYLFNGFSRPSMTFYTVISYRLTGDNNSYFGNSSYKIGNNFRLLAGLSDQVAVGSIVVNPSLGVRFRNAKQDKFNSEFLPSTGGNWVFLIPGIGVLATPNLTIETNLELPLYANPQGTQLTPTFRFNLGLFYVLNRAEENDFN